MRRGRVSPYLREFLAVFLVVSLFGVVFLFFVLKLSALQRESFLSSLGPAALEVLYKEKGMEELLKPLCYSFSKECFGSLQTDGWCLKKVMHYCGKLYGRSGDVGALKESVRACALLGVEDESALECFLKGVSVLSGRQLSRFLRSDAEVVALADFCSSFSVGVGDCDFLLDNLRSLISKAGFCSEAFGRVRASLLFSRLVPELALSFGRLKRGMLRVKEELERGRERGFCPPEVFAEDVEHMVDLEVRPYLSKVRRTFYLIKRLSGEFPSASEFVRRVEVYERDFSKAGPKP